VILGDHAILAAQVGIAGSSHVGSRVMMGGQAGVAGHLSIGEGAIVGGQAGVTKDVPPGTFVTGYPAAPHEKAARAHAGLMRLPQLKERLAELETRLRKLEEKLDAPPERP
jgi:UDP-3-O-[3-hydroxymyristoyl] glucosamine N-acyltransferase